MIAEMPNTPPTVKPKSQNYPPGDETKSNVVEVKKESPLSSANTAARRVKN
jgi:hypothetical protein